MSIMRCDQCERSVDTDFHDTETFRVGENDFITVCETCAEKIHADQEAEMRAAKAEYDAASEWERNPDTYRTDMIAAGRGHLLGDE